MLGSEMLYRLRCFVYRELKAPIINPYRPPAYRHMGNATSEPILESLIEPIKLRHDRECFRRHLRPTDVFLIGHPKSGNTWMAYMLGKLLNKDHMHQVTMASVGNYVPIIHGQDSRICEHEGLPNPRVFRNEYPVHAQLYPKTIYLIRDPRAVLVSYHRMYCVTFPDAPMTLREFINEYLQNGYIRGVEPLVRWDQQVQDWHERAKHDDRIILVRYEDMVNDRGAELEKASKFCGISYTEAQFQAVIEQSSFEAMKKSEETYGAEAYMGIKEKRGSFVRRGKPDSWREEMDVELIAKIESEFAPAMRSLGYA
jgi:hypothetical protein